MDGLLRNKTAYHTQGSQRERSKADLRALIIRITERSIWFKSIKIPIEYGNMINMVKKLKMVSAPLTTEALSALQTCIRQQCREQTLSRNIWLKIRATTSWRTLEANRACNSHNLMSLANVQAFTSLWLATRAWKESLVEKIFLILLNQRLPGKVERVLLYKVNRLTYRPMRANKHIICHRICRIRALRACKKSI